MSRINWDYVIGLVAGAVVATVCRKTYERGVNDGIERSIKTYNFLTDFAEEMSEETDGEES